MSHWKTVKEKIATKELDSKTWRSDQTNLLKVAEAAAEYGLNPVHAQKASISNLRAIIKPAKKAIQAGDKELLDQLFELASTLSNRDLRTRTNKRKIETIYFQKINDVIVLKLTPRQHELICKYTKQYFSYKEKK